MLSLITSIFTGGDHTQRPEDKIAGAVKWARHVGKAKSHRAQSAIFFTRSLRRQTQGVQAEVQVMFTNNAAAELCVPLPVGIVRVYTGDTDDVPQSLGEGGIEHTVVGSEVSVKLGENFDAPIMREKTNFVRASDNITLTSWGATVRNAKSDPVVVRVVEQLPGSWKIMKENASHKNSMRLKSNGL
jgi:hypothetical protein